jgi:hypothetical protein
MRDFATYILTCQDDTDILINAVKSAIELGPVWLFDTGQGVRYQHHSEDFIPVYGFYRQCKARGWPVQYSDLVHWGEQDVDYSTARTKIGRYLAQFCKWVLMLDSDEMLSNEFVHGLPGLLDGISDDIVTIAPEWLTLWPDDQHFAWNYSGVLSHGRIYRPDSVSWTNRLHEHQSYTGKRIEWDRKIIHFRQLFSQRSQIQNGHGGDAWPRISDDIRPISQLEGVTWPNFTWSNADRPVLQPT